MNFPDVREALSVSDNGLCPMAISTGTIAVQLDFCPEIVTIDPSSDFCVKIAF